MHIHGLDYARAFFSVFVVLWHFHIFGTSPLFTETTASPYMPSIFDLINFNVFLLAVPFFILASCYLYASKAETLHYLWRRIVRILTLLTFWAIASHLFYGGADGFISALGKLHEHPIYQTVTALNTYSFFVGLLVSVMLSAMASHHRNATLVTWLILAMGVICLFQWLAISHGVVWAAAFWNPLNYVAYPAAASLIFRVSNNNSALLSLLGWTCAGLFFLTASLEWRFLVHPAFFPGQAYNLPAYTRLSSLFLACAILIVCLYVQRPAGKIIGFMSQNSLGLYCVHPFLLAPWAKMEASAWLKAVSAILTAYIIVILLRKFFIRDAVLA